MKVSHLRALPHPPAAPRALAALAALTRHATDRGIDPSTRAELDAQVFELFGLSASERAAVAAFVLARG